MRPGGRGDGSAIWEAAGLFLFARLAALRRGGFAFQFLDAFEGPHPQRLRVARDRGFAGAQHLRGPAIEGRDKLPQLVNELSRHRHRGVHCRLLCTRPTFHTSPHAVQRQ